MGAGKWKSRKQTASSPLVVVVGVAYFDIYACVHHEQSTGIEWLITRFREYVVVREKVLLETMVIRKQLELNPNAELSAAAQEVQRERER